jgi:hypothetical protein
VLGNGYGESNLAGVVTFIGGGSAMLFTIISAGLIAIAAFKKAKALRGKAIVFAIALIYLNFTCQ